MTSIAENTASCALCRRHLLVGEPARLYQDPASKRFLKVCPLCYEQADRRGWRADGRPIVGPVDSIFFRGAFVFGSSPDSVRFRHIRRRPAVSATHLPGEELAVTVHGRAVPIDVTSPEQAGFRQTLLDIYVPRYGADWESFLDSGPVYARIDADRMFTFHMSDGS